MFLTNDLLHNQQDKHLTGLLQKIIGNLVSTIVQGSFNEQLVKKVLDILKVWLGKSIFEQSVVQQWTDQLEKFNAAKLVLELPPGLSQIPNELVKMIENEAARDGFIDKYRATHDSDNKEKAEKYMLLTLRNYKEVLQLIDKQHSRMVVNLKLMLLKKQQLREFQYKLDAESTA